ncbi:hypothetical protein FF38_12983 [Lucilia cuprina]|uniref:Condensin-2 complex subunit H2 C-terminal domain-containing protein n=1 Tax=Lucilia cuprina TaxID=7375 RepID=A0A0L0BZT0_LUCCU|nr:hypothetical protein CVS40_0939 [Lucilia cuprina]KNC25560.1 hypothetical protein FF38_12983 [Lucilia cuprina]
MADALTEILRAASKHPNSRVSKLIHTVEEEPSQKNIVLLLIELAEHAEYSTDFNVSLKYYLDLFEHLGINSDLVLNEAGLLLVNSSKIYSKRVDYVQSLVERQILTLSNADDELQKQKLEQEAAAENAATPTEKPKRGRKRALDAPSDPYEVELIPKKFKKLTEEKRFAAPKTPQKAKSVLRNIEMEQHIHPAGWLHATIYDLENEEDVDTKRNYKLFTYHVEHRYNTLVPDINFRLHFKVKDYIDEQEEMEADEACNTDRSWPPLSEAYVQKYLRLENYVLQQDLKVNKRKAAEMEEDDDLDKSQDTDVIIKDDNDNKNETQLEQTMLDSSTAETAAADTTKDNLDSTNSNGKNDSGLGQSLLDESVPSDSTNIENLNDTNIAAESNKSLNVTENIQENDSALGTSVLDQTSNTENNTTGNLDNTTNSENLNETNTEEPNKSLNITENQQENDSALGTSVLDQTDNTENNTTIEEGNLDTTTNAENPNETNEEEANNSLNATENDSALSNSVLDQTNNTSTATEGNFDETTAETSGILETSSGDNEANETTTEMEKEGDKSTNTAALIVPIENRKDSALSDDRHHSISTENLAMSMENLNKIDDKTLQIDLGHEKDKDNNQLQVQLPHTDDEGVYLSDQEEHDCRMLSPIINATNILPGVERKDITIYMDDELRQALDMRDGIMEHFSHETYKVPVITEPKKQNLLFNIFKLPEKLVRRKVIFKLGPEMDLYLQARSLKRSRPEQPTRSTRAPQLLQWFSLNNTDMTGVCMSPPYSPGHCSEFYGFSDNEDDDDDTLSCADFCGFTEEEQSTLMIKHTSRLSRDSGVGVDVNALTPEKETLEIIFEDGEISAIDNCKKVLNLEEMPVSAEQCTEAILNQLPEEIRDVLTTELKENNETTNDESQITETQESCSQAIDSQVSINNTEDTENVATESSVENSESLSSENPSTNNTQESDTKLTECSTESLQECSESTETLATSGSQETTTEQTADAATEATTSESQDKLTDVPVESEIPKETNVASKPDDDVEIKDIIISNTEESHKSAEELLKEKLDAANSMEESDNFDHHVDITEDCDSDEDDEMLNLDTQGTKTKIQQWHEHLQPILAKSRERHHFDVFKLGTEIIQTVQSTKPAQDDKEETLNDIKSKRPVASFQDIMDNKDTSYVSRYFLSTLLLANQSNIEISIENKSSEKPSSWHDIQLKLLSTKRHTVAIEDNIGMIDNKLKVGDRNDKKDKQNTKPEQEKLTNPIDEEEDEPLIKLQNSKKSPKKTKTSLKRASDNNTTANIALKKPKEITHSRHNELPNLIESVQIIKSPQIKELNLLPSTSRQSQLLNTSTFKVNINNVRTLQPIEKKLANQNLTKYFRKIKKLPILVKV